MYEYRVDLDRVVDGDTIDVDIDLGFGISIHKRIRLAGINAPETRTKDKEEKRRGFEAKDWLRSVLPNGDLSIKTFKDSTGKYGRILAEVYVDEMHVQTEMLNLGLVEIYK